jgi:hypothetical protein
MSKRSSLNTRQGFPAHGCVSRIRPELSAVNYLPTLGLEKKTLKATLAPTVHYVNFDLQDMKDRVNGKFIELPDDLHGEELIKWLETC